MEYSTDFNFSIFFFPHKYSIQEFRITRFQKMEHRISFYVPFFSTRYSYLYRMYKVIRKSWYERGQQFYDSKYDENQEQ